VMFDCNWNYYIYKSGTDQTRKNVFQLN